MVSRHINKSSSLNIFIIYKMSEVFKCSNCGKISTGGYPNSVRFIHGIRNRTGSLRSAERQEIELPENVVRAKYYICPYCNKTTVFNLEKNETKTTNVISVNDSVVENATFTTTPTVGDYVIKNGDEVILTFKIVKAGDELR